MSPRKSAKKRNRSSRVLLKRKRKKLSILRSLWPLVFGSLILGLGGAVAYGLHLDTIIRTRFEGKLWSLPSRLYARPLELFAGLRLSKHDFTRELKMLGYREESNLEHPGAYRRSGEFFEVKTRPFDFWDEKAPSRKFRISFDSSGVAGLSDLDIGQQASVVRLDPLQIGSFYPDNHQDRILVKPSGVPKLLILALVAVEDRNFFRHSGVDLKAIGRATLANLKAGHVVQGGSTLTQQLVKNYFLNSKKTFSRKINEAFMAAILEFRYDKDALLNAYLNEIYLGQQPQRAIHGVGLASQFYFGRPVAELDLPRIALLVGLIRAPSQYDPRRHPNRAKERRNTVLDLLASQAIISMQQAANAKQSVLGVIPNPPIGEGHHPAFIDLVHRQLREYYREKDLGSEGLSVFTTLDPVMQRAAEEALRRRIGLLESQRGTKAGPLEGAIVITRPQTGEILALVSGKEASFAGFNRAVDSKRPIGSLVKPAVFLTALKNPEEYTLATLIEDAPVQVKNPSGKTWAPSNYDHEVHGAVTLYEALTNSYNLATVRLGLNIGVEHIAETLRHLGVSKDIKPYPSLLLGALELSPLEVAQAYQPFANGGFLAPTRAIKEVVNATGAPLERYPLTVSQAFDSDTIYLINCALQGVVTHGTGAGLRSVLPEGTAVAGKTGTTDDLRDSWFAGFTRNWLAVVWLGRDNNRPSGLTGAQGALKVWADLFSIAGGEPLEEESTSPGVEFAWIDPKTGRVSKDNSESSIRMPFISGSSPSAMTGSESADEDKSESGPASFWDRITSLFGEQNK